MVVLKKIKKNYQKYFTLKVIKKLVAFYNTLDVIYPQELIIKQNDKILVLAPHPDDEVIGCGGLLLKYAKNCDVVCLSDGRYGDENIEPLEMAEIRKKEFENVMNEIDVNGFDFLYIEDSKVKYSYNKFKQIEFKKYDYIFIPNYLDQHPDHKAVLELLLKAYKENLINKNTKIAMYEIWNALCLINYYTDISNITDKKKEIINKYCSQVKHIDYAKKILALNEYRGLAVGKKSIEAYFILNIQDLVKVIDE